MNEGSADNDVPPPLPTEDPLRSQLDQQLRHGTVQVSSSAAFLDAVEPLVIVVSAGHRNSYGVPHPEVLERYADAGVFIFRTDLDGAIEMSILAPGLRIRTAAAQALPD